MKFMNAEKESPKTNKTEAGMERMKNQFSGAFKSVKDFWGKLSKKAKSGIIISILFVIVGAVGLTIYLNSTKKGYQVLFPGMTSEEAVQVYNLLQEDETVEVEMNSKGEILVPAEQFDRYIMQLAAEGYHPSSTLNYDVFTQNTGFTATELETMEILKYQLQERVQGTIKQIEGVSNVIVTLTIPKNSNYVWDSTKEVATASVTITMRKDANTLSEEQASAIKNLVAYGVPTMKPENVKVIDTATGVEIGATEGSDTKYSSSRIKYEREIATDLEEKATRILASRFGGGVRASATVKINYEEMVSEIRTLLDKDDEGNRILKHNDETYNVNGKLPASGIVGEQNNTDTPTYDAEDPNADGTTDTSSYSRSYDYDQGYSLEQLKRVEPILEEASIAVVVDDPDFITNEDTIIELVSSATHIDAENITVSDLGYVAPEIAEPPVEDAINTQDTGLTTQTKIIIAVIVGVVLLLLIIIVLVIVSIARKKTKQRLLEEEQKSEETIQTLQQEIDSHKRALKEAAEATNSKENAITNEVRTFAKENPEITASLIRTMLKEDE